MSNSALAFSKCFLLLAMGALGVPFVVSETLYRFFNSSLYWSKFWYPEEKLMMTKLLQNQAKFGDDPSCKTIVQFDQSCRLV